MTADQWIALGGLGVAALGLQLTALAMVLRFFTERHARSESYRAAVYTAQISTALDLLKAIARAYSLAELLIEPPKGTRASLRSELVRAVLDLDDVRTASALLLPENVLAASSQARTALATAASSGSPKDATPEQRQGALDDAWTNVVAAMRAELGVDELQEPIRALTGVARREREKADRDARLRYLDLQLEVLTRGRSRNE